MKNFTFVFFAFFLLFIVTIKNVYSQKSLYLVNTLTGTATNNRLWEAKGIGDFSGDGYDDFLICTPSLTGSDSVSRVYLYLGNKDSISTLPYKTFGPFKDFTEIKPAGDLNGDGKKDFIISTHDTVRIYIGNNEPLLYDATQLGTGGYVSVGTGGDINHDGYDDFLIGNTNHRNSDSIMVGAVIGFWGGNSIDLSSEAFSMEGDQKWFEYGKAINIAGDINGDGCADVFILQPSYPDYNNPTGKLFIYSYKEITGINNNGIGTTTNFKLNQNYPNPFNPSTAISFQLSANGYVTLKIFNSLGQEVAVLVNNKMEYPGIEFDAEKYNLSSGVYFLEMNAAEINSHIYNNQKVIKMLYLK